jgi:hypothetical protein
VERREDQRAGDADRQRVADRLREAVDEGRLNLSEYDERLQRTYAAKTYGDLNGLLDDLPPVVPAQHSQLLPATAAQVVADVSQTRRWLGRVWGSWLTTSVICTGIWAATSLGDGSAHTFWPFWVIVPWGTVLTTMTVRGFLNGDHRRAPPIKD